MSTNTHDGAIKFPYKIENAKILTVEFDDGQVSYIYCLPVDLNWVLEELQSYPCQIQENDAILKAMDEDALMKICYPLKSSKEYVSIGSLFKGSFSGEGITVKD